VNVYLAAIRNPVIHDAPSSVGNALAGDAIYLFWRNMESVYRYRGGVREPTFTNLAFPPAPLNGSFPISVPAAQGYAGAYAFAAVFILRDTGRFVRTDGMPVEISNGARVR
jgi:hypothetical protein